MLTFSVNTVIDPAYIIRVKKAIDANIPYFKTLNGDRWEEAVQKAYSFALVSRNEDFADITPYIKKLARTVLKVTTKETSYDMEDEKGEVSYPFMGLITEDSQLKCLVDYEDINRKYKELYLLYTEEFIKLKNLYIEKEEIKYKKAERVQSPEIREEINKLVTSYGADVVFYTLNAFLKKIEKNTSLREDYSTKLINIKKCEGFLKDLICYEDVIEDKKGKHYKIDSETLLMQINPDYIKWEPINKAGGNIYKIDISRYMNYLYEEVYVEEGVNTHYITWCEDMFKAVTPCGKVYLNPDKEDFLNMCRIELVENLVTSKFNIVIALSVDSVYIRSLRELKVKTIRCRLQTGKNIDLPVTLYLRMRKEG